MTDNHSDSRRPMLRDGVRETLNHVGSAQSVRLPWNEMEVHRIVAGHVHAAEHTEAEKDGVLVLDSVRGERAADAIPVANPKAAVGVASAAAKGSFRCHSSEGVEAPNDPKLSDRSPEARS